MRMDVDGDLFDRGSWIVRYGKLWDLAPDDGCGFVDI